MIEGRLREACRTWFFAPAGPVPVAVLRIVASVTALWVLLSRDLAPASAAPDAIWAEVPAGRSWRFLIVPGHETVEWSLQWIAIVLLIAVALGIAARAASLASCLLLYHLAPLEGPVFGTDADMFPLTLPILSLLILSQTRSADALGVVRPRVHEASWEYRWPIAAMQVIVASVYVFAGYSKVVAILLRCLRTTCLEAVEGARFEFIYMSLGIEHRLLPWSPALAFADPRWFWLIWAGILLFEIGFVAALWNSRARRVLLPLAVLFHLFTFVQLNIFVVVPAFLVVFVDWDRRTPMANR